MKKLLILVVSLVILIGLGWYVTSLVKNDGKSDRELIEFAIENTDAIDRIVISDAFNRKIEIHKEGDIWTDESDGCITQQSVEFILEAFRNIEFKGYIPDNSHQQYTKLMTSQNTKVEIFQDGEWIKTWYIGPSSQDHYGQIMLLDSKEFGKSDIPVMMKIKGVNGIIEPRFFADKRKWMCTNIFKIPLYKLAKVDVKFYDEPERSFTVAKKKSDMKVYQQDKLLSNVDTAMIFRYLNNYQKIHFDMPNYELDEQEIDSLKATTPFATISVTETNGKKTKLRLFRILVKEANAQGQIIIEDKDKDRLWCELANGQIVKCQYFVFNPLLLGHIYFPLDVSNLKTHDGLTVK